MLKIPLPGWPGVVFDWLDVTVVLPSWTVVTSWDPGWVPTWVDEVGGTWVEEGARDMDARAAAMMTIARATAPTPYFAVSLAAIITQPEGLARLINLRRRRSFDGLESQHSQWK
jgi:hypothetical protein